MYYQVLLNPFKQSCNSAKLFQWQKYEINSKKYVFIGCKGNHTESDTISVSSLRLQNFSDKILHKHQDHQIFHKALKTRMNRNKRNTFFDSIETLNANWYEYKQYAMLSDTRWTPKYWLWSKSIFGIFVMREVSIPFCIKIHLQW